MYWCGNHRRHDRRRALPRGDVGGGGRGRHDLWRAAVVSGAKPRGQRGRAAEPGDPASAERSLQPAHGGDAGAVRRAVCYWPEGNPGPRHGGAGDPFGPDVRAGPAEPDHHRRGTRARIRSARRRTSVPRSCWFQTSGPTLDQSQTDAHPRGGVAGFGPGPRSYWPRGDRSIWRGGFDSPTIRS